MRESTTGHVILGFWNESFGPAIEASAEAPQLAYWLLALRHGQVISRARVRWAEEAERLPDAADRGNAAVLATWRALIKEDA